MTGTENKIETIEKEDVVDNLETKEDNKPKVDMDKLAALKEMAAKKRAAEETPKEQVEEDDVPIKIVEERKRSLNFGVIGSGQGGSRVAEQWYKLGYPTIVCNTAEQDLSGIDISPKQKIFLDFGLGGTARDLSLGEAAAEAYSDVIADAIERNLSDCHAFIFCTSLGGGSGAGSLKTIVELLSRFGKPVIVMGILPKNSEDAQSKDNSYQTLSKLTKFVDEGKVDNIIIIDNAKVESVYSWVSPFNFFSVANKASVEVLEVFNTLSRRPSEGVKILDSNEFGKILIDGKGFTVYGQMELDSFEDEMCLATAIVESLNGNLLASGFDIKTAKYAGYVITGNENCWNKIPSSSLDYAQHMIMDSCDSPAIFHGIYKDNSKDDKLRIYSIFSGLGLPTSRLEQLKNEAKQKMDLAKKKDVERKLSIKVDVGDEVVNKTEMIRNKIQQKASSFNKLNSGLVQDRRK